IIEPYRHILSTRPDRIPGSLRDRYKAVVADGWERLASHHALTQLAPQLGIAVSEAGKLVYKGYEVDYVVVDSGNRRVLAVEAKWSPLDKREIQGIVRETMAKVHRVLPGYDVTVALYAREVSESNLDDAIIVTPEDLPWKRDCR
ncbi:MAG: DUF234 domain-containing protein, partial [Desulfurococcales archaeon]|nr:DUF234 domain-containing protein [Desulfurococcales archaeon]